MTSDSDDPRLMGCDAIENFEWQHRHPCSREAMALATMIQKKQAERTGLVRKCTTCSYHQSRPNRRHSPSQRRSPVLGLSQCHMADISRMSASRTQRYTNFGKNKKQHPGTDSNRHPRCFRALFCQSSELPRPSRNFVFETRKAQITQNAPNFFC